MSRRTRHRLATVALILAPACVVCWLPLCFMLVVASRESSAATTFPPPLLPGDRLLANIGAVMELVPLGRALVNSFLVSASVATAQALLCALAGYAFAKLRFRGRRTLFAIVLVALVLPVQLAVIPNFLLISRLGWGDTLQALIVPGLASAFGIFWMRQHISVALSDDVIAAAALDGCGPAKTFWHVGLPMVLPGTVVLGAIVFVSTWTDFTWPFIVLRSPGTSTVQVALAALRTDYGVDYSLAFAGALLATVPVLVFAVVLSGRRAWLRVDR
ncbi:carbohydrate ABC transporter permease [Microbacterium sp. C23T]